MTQYRHQYCHLADRLSLTFRNLSSSEIRVQKEKKCHQKLSVKNAERGALSRPSHGATCNREGLARESLPNCECNTFTLLLHFAPTVRIQTTIRRKGFLQRAFLLH